VGGRIESGFGLDMVLVGKIPVPPNHAFQNHCFLIEL